MLVLVFGLAYAWRKGALDGIRKPKSSLFHTMNGKTIDTLSKMASELNDGGTNLVLGNLDQLINWGRVILFGR